MPLPANPHALGTNSVPAKLDFMESQYENKNDHTVRFLYPTLTENQPEIAAANFRRYVQIAAEIQQEMESKPHGFDIGPNPSTMKERSNANLQS